MPVIEDEEFGKITIRRSARSRQVRLRVGPDGLLKASLPVYAPLFLVKRLVKTSRDQLRELLDQASTHISFVDGMRIGKSHVLRVRETQGALQVKRGGQHINVLLPVSSTLEDPDVVREIRRVLQSALRIEAKSYLPKRLAYIAEEHGYVYTQVRFSHASGRWGSCNSEGVISLNIALMKLPFELIDYVIIHELAHTRFLNHSESFWKQVSLADPDYRNHRKALKQESPSI
jgi:predicted metal-dependent hydrolase